jgi:hypothetical protein
MSDSARDVLGLAALSKPVSPWRASLQQIDDDEGFK